MWPIVMALMRRNAVYLTLPFAAVVGFIGYNVENLISDKYTPYSRKLLIYNAINEMSKVWMTIKTRPMLLVIITEP